jgi:hypothetical protein
MFINQILLDINKFQKIIIDEGLFEYSPLPPLLLELCLKSKGIKSTLVLGYLVDNDKYWFYHIWNKLEINGEFIYLDMCKNHQIVKFMGPQLQYSFELKPHWTSLMCEKFPDDPNLMLEQDYNIYLKKDASWWIDKELKYSIVGCYKKVWKNIISRARKLKTFDNIESFVKLGKEDKYCH